MLASFSKADGVLLEEEIDSSLGFLRYDYPEAVYSELRQLFRQALYEQQDLVGDGAKAQSAQLSTDRKIMLGVQLYDLISQAGLKQEQVVAFYSFMSQLGMAAQAIDIVYQLNASEDSDPAVYQRGASPLESISFGNNGQSDVMLKSLMRQRPAARLSLSRFDPAEELQRAERVGPRPAAGARRVLPHLSGPTHSGRRSGAHLIRSWRNYFNAKKNVSLPQIFVRVNQDADEVELERSRSRESCAGSHFRPESAGEGAARRRCRTQRHHG